MLGVGCLHWRSAPEEEEEEEEESVDYRQKGRADYLESAETPDPSAAPAFITR